MPGIGPVDVVFVLRRLSEILRAKNKLFFIFFDLEKALIRCQGKLLILLSGKRMFQNIW